MPMLFSNEEYADIYYVYGLCDGNALVAQQEYHRRYSNRRLPTRAVFINQHRQLREHGSFNARHAVGQGVVRRPVNDDDQVLDLLQEDPSLSVRRIALRTGICRSQIWRITRTARLRPYHHQRVQALDNDFQARLRFCNWVQNNQHLPHILWTDEASFTRDGINNYHNFHEWTTENPHLRRRSHFQHRFSVNMIAGILNDRLIGPFELPQRLNGPTFLENSLPLLLEDVPLNIRRAIWYQHDGAPAHQCLRVRAWLNAHFPGRWIGLGGPVVWPPRSPDLTPLDFYLWGHMKQIF